ncbi:MAG: LacI family DNA-binding transcriptional regulator [Faecousia sp.]
MNIRDISEKSGVSVATVSRVINGSDRVSEKTRLKVLRVMEEQGYTPNAFARSLGLKTMKAMGICYSDASDLYLSNAVYHLEREFRNLGYDSLLCCTDYDLGSRRKYVRWLLSKKVDAIVLVGSHFVESYDPDNDYIRATASQVPVAVLGAPLTGDGISSVCCDDYRASLELAGQLLDTGSRKILFLYHTMSASVRQKLRGLQDACRDRGLPFRNQYAVLCPQRDPEDCARFLTALRHQLEFDTVMTMDDLLAVGALKFAQAEGIPVPEGLRIAGYNNSLLSRCTTPELTTVDNHTEALCRRLAELLAEQLAGKPGRQETMEGTILLRGSV